MIINIFKNFKTKKFKLNLILFFVNFFVILLNIFFFANIYIYK